MSSPSLLPSAVKLPQSIWCRSPSTPLQRTPSVKSNCGDSKETQQPVASSELDSEDEEEEDDEEEDDSDGEEYFYGRSECDEEELLNMFASPLTLSSASILGS